MSELGNFNEKVKAILDQIDADTLSYDESEFWMIQSPYEYIEYYSTVNNLINTAVALPLARGVHDGSHRKSKIMKYGVEYKRPYVIHCIMVCKMLADLNIRISSEEEDVMLAAALCHDMIEDIPFPNGGQEMITDFKLDPRVYDIVKLVSKRKDFTLEEEQAHFHGIESDRLALLVKLSDRAHNVEDLYNRSAWKVHEYVEETRTYFLPMCEYGFRHYPELNTAIGVLHDKIVSLTEAAEILVDRYDEREQEYRNELRELKKENERLRKEWHEIWRG